MSVYNRKDYKDLSVLMDHYRKLESKLNEGYVSKNELIKMLVIQDVLFQTKMYESNESVEYEWINRLKNKLNSLDDIYNLKEGDE